LSVLHDDNHDGVSDRQEVLIQGISTEDVARRGADHTTNGIQLGIDGWIYIAVGDYGVVEARGTDGTTLNRRGGGIIRVRPDGTDMEIYVWGLRNVLDACIDPMMNVFTRDNTNDGGGWDVRLSQIFQSAEYGYPSWYLNFHEDLMPPLADYGGGSGCGGLFLDDARWPKAFGHALYTADWGRSEVYVHHLTPSGPTFSADQQTFVKIPRPTDVDVDGSGRMYVSSWKGGQFNYAGPNVGFIAQIVPAGLELKPFPDLATLSPDSLIALFNSPDQKHRLHAQLELLRHGRSPETSSRLVAFLHDAQNTLFGRVAALYTLAQLDGADSHAALIELAGVPELQASVLRALTDRRQLVKNLPSAPFLDGLKSRDPAVQAQALICIGRLGRVELAEAVLPLSVRADGQAMTSHKHNEPDPGSVLPHLAVRTLVSLQATDACLKALSGPYRVGALNALKFMHLPAAVEGLIDAVNAAKSPQEQLQTLTALVRLYHQEAKYLKNWWGTRPDRTGPYYDRQVWSESPRIASTVAALFQAAAPAERQAILELLKKHQVEIPGVAGAPDAGPATGESNQPITLPKVDPGNKNQIANMPYEEALQRALKTPGNSAQGAKLFEAQACIACHTYQAGQAPKGPHLADIGKRYPRPELIESILKPSAKIAQGFDTQVFMTVDGKVYTGFVSSEGAEEIQIRQSNGVSITLPKSQIEDRAKQEQSMMPAGIVNNLTPEQLADLLAWLESLKTK
jgi:putative heme-binding domain-containing protein